MGDDPPGATVNALASGMIFPGWPGYLTAIPEELTATRPQQRLFRVLRVGVHCGELRRNCLLIDIRPVLMPTPVP
jgi:hypothetical protein